MTNEERAALVQGLSDCVVYGADGAERLCSEAANQIEADGKRIRALEEALRDHERTEAYNLRGYPGYD